MYQGFSLSSPFPKEGGKNASLNREKCSPLNHSKLSTAESVLFSIMLIWSLCIQETYVTLQETLWAS